MSQGKAKKKLLYTHGGEAAKPNVKTKKVYTLKNVESFLNDFDDMSAIRRPLISPLPKSGCVKEKKTSGFTAEPVHEVVEESSSDQDGTFKEIVPLSTSSPLESTCHGSKQAVERLSPVVDPMIFGIQDEDLAAREEGSLSSPPERLEFKKNSKPRDDVPSRSEDQRSPDLAEKNEVQIEETEPNQDQMMIETDRALRFQHRLKKALIPEMQRKPHPAPVLCPVDFEEEFRILDDEAPVLFIIPRKTNALKKNIAGRCSSDQISARQTDKNRQQTADLDKNEPIDSGTQKPKGRSAKKTKKSRKDFQERVEHGADDVTPGVVGEDIPSQTVEVHRNASGKQSQDASPPESNGHPDCETRKSDDNCQGTPGLVSKSTNKTSKASSSQPKVSRKKTAPAAPDPTSSARSHSNDKTCRKGKTVSKTKKIASAPQAPEATEHAANVEVDKQIPESLVDKAGDKEPAKNKRKEESATKPAPAEPPDTLQDIPGRGKRRKKSPGSWWLVSQDDGKPEREFETNTSTTPAVARKSREKQPPKPSTSSSCKKALEAYRKKHKIGTGQNGGRRTKPKAASTQAATSPPMEDERERDSGTSPLHRPDRQCSVARDGKRTFDQAYTLDAGSARKQSISPHRTSEVVLEHCIPQKRQRKALSNWWEVQECQKPAEYFPLHWPAPEKPRKSSEALFSVFKGNPTQFPTNEAEIRPKSRNQRRRHLHSVEDQSSENMVHSDDELQENALLDLTVHRSVQKASSGINTQSDIDVAFKSGPSSLLNLHQYEEEDDADLPSSRVVPVQLAPRVLAHCDLCGPPLQSIVLEEEDWNNLNTWFSYMWHPASKEGRVASPDDFHWSSYDGRAMGHTIDLQSSSFSHGRMLLGSFMKKPSQMDRSTSSIFSLISSCVRVEVDGVKSVCNPGQVFMILSGQVYSIQNLCQEPAVLLYYKSSYLNQTAE